MSPRTQSCLGVHALCLLTCLIAAQAARAQTNRFCLDFNSDPEVTGEYVSIPDKTGLQGLAKYTLEAWVFPTALGSSATVLGNDYQVSYWLGLTPEGRVKFYPGGGPARFIESVGALPTMRWTHLAAVFESDAGASLYVNGELAVRDTALTGPGSGSIGDLRIGADRDGASASFFWAGGIDEIRIWGVARTEAQIRESRFTAVGGALFFSPAYSGLRANWVGFEGPAPGQLRDEHGATFDDVANHGVFVGGPAGGILSTKWGHANDPNIALQLNGIDDFADSGFPDDTPLGLTLSAWIAPFAAHDTMTVVGRDRTRSFWLGVTLDGRLEYRPRGGEGTLASDSGVIRFGHWQHVAASHDGTTTRLYVNGVPVASSIAMPGPVPSDGVTPALIGADRTGMTIRLPYAGLIDDVRFFRGIESPEQIRARMWQGHTTTNVSLLDASQALRSARYAFFDSFDAGTRVHGSQARFVTSGAALSQGTSLDPGIYRTRVVGGSSELPADTSNIMVVADTLLDFNHLVHRVQVVIMAPVSDLSRTEVSLRSPAGTTIRLVRRGEAFGRSLHTLFTDEAQRTVTGPGAPFQFSVHPSEDLSGFNGEFSSGVWRLELNGDATGLSPASVGLWAWGIRINDDPLDAPPSALPERTALWVEGGNPATGAIALAYRLSEGARVRLDLFDTQGRRVRTPHVGWSPAGTSVVRWDASGIAPGVYRARLRDDRGIIASVPVVLSR